MISKTQNNDQRVKYFPISSEIPFSNKGRFLQCLFFFNSKSLKIQLTVWIF